MARQQQGTRKTKMATILSSKQRKIKVEPQNLCNQKQSLSQSESKGTLPPTQIKSRKRVKEFAEVYTNEREVNAMLDLIPNITIEMTFLEPSCGNGNFLIEILKRKLQLAKTDDEVLQCYSTIFGIDIQEDNVIESRERMLNLLPNSALTNVVKQILNKNIKVGDFLKEEL